MKTKLIIFSAFYFVLNANSQVSTPANFGTITDYVGWNAAQAFPLLIEHKGNQRINFSTSGGIRMLIDAGGGLNGGRLAIGNNLPALFAPQSRVHIHQTGNTSPLNQTYVRFTNNQTGPTATDGFAIGNNSSSSGPILGDVQLQQYEQAPVSIFLPNGGGVLTNYFHILNGTGFTGINTNAPTRQFDVNGKVRVQNLISNGANAGLVTHFADGTLQNLLFTGNPAQVLLGNGTWGPIPPGGGGVSFCAPLPNNNVVKATLVANQVCGTNIFDLPGGLVGINTPAPNDALDVQNGNIDVVTPTNSYRIGNSDFLWHKGATTCLYAGVGAGNGQNAASLNNIFMGFNAGFNSTNLANNVTNIGYESGFNDQGAGSVFIGRRAGFSNVPGDFNTFVGSNAGEFNVAGAVNAYMGFRSGQNNDGNSNVMIGVNSGQTITNGDNNVLLGGQTNSTKVNLINGVALGFNSIVRNDDQMILGNNNINVGIGLSNDINGPQNKLEIKRTNTASSLSGLRLTDLATALPAAANGLGLSINPANGDVILVSASAGGGGFGNLCSAPVQNPLTGDFEVPLSNFKYLFTGQSVVNNIAQLDVIAVGYNCNTQLPPSKFSSLQQQLPVSTSETFAGHFKNADISNANLEITGGVFAQTKSSALNFNSYNIGGVFEGNGALQSIGALGRITKSLPTLGGVPAGRYAMGGAFISDSAVTNVLLPIVQNFGVYGMAANSPVNNYGVYGEVPTSNNPGVVANFAIYGSSPSNIGNGFEYAGYFSGDVTVTGIFNNPSDLNLKQNIDTIPNALNLIKQLKPKQFDYKTAQYPNMNLSSGLQYGLIAQDAQTVVPAIVTNNNHPAKYDNMGNIVNPSVNYKGIEYQQLIPILIRAVQQLSDQNKMQDSLIQVLTQNIASCCSNSNVSKTGIIGNSINVELSDKNIIVLNQNLPNPFAENTVITYNIPVDFKVAQIIFNAMDGRIIKSVDINQKGKGELNVYANDLTNGLYSYYLVVDGKVIDTKKLIKQN